MIDAIRRELEQYEGQWILPDDIDALIEIIEGAIGMGPPKVTYGLDKFRTHWAECWRYASHHACAVMEIERLAEIAEALRLANATVRQENERLRKLLDATGMDWSRWKRV